MRPRAPGKAAARLFALILLFFVTPAAAQLRSGGASVGLVATLPDSVSVQHQAVPLAQSFAEGEPGGLEVVHVFLHWRLRPGHSVQVQPLLETEGQAAPLAVASGFLSLQQLNLASYLSSFQPPQGKSARLLGTFLNEGEKHTGRASLLIGAGRQAQAERPTVRISIAVL